jgi:tetratricopeptide (TPR) repeat protein
MFYYFGLSCVDFAKANAEKANISWDEGFKFFQPEYILQSQDYFLLFDLRFAQDIQEGYRFLEDKMESKVPNIGYSYLGYILKNTENHLVITTNFDHLLEEALQQLSGHYPLVIGHELMSSFMNDNLKRRPIIAKVHRDLLLKPMNRTIEMKHLQKEWKEPITKALERYVPIVIGYGGGDKTLMQMLEQINLNGVFWCIRRGSKLPNTAEKIVKKNNGQCVEINGFEELMRQMVFSFFEMEKKNESNNRQSILNLKKKHVDIEIQHVEIIGEKLEDALQIELKGRFEAIRQEPNNAFLYYLCGVTLHKIGRFEEALLEKDIAIMLNPVNPSFYRSRSITLRAMGDYVRSSADKRKAVDLFPDEAWLYYQRSLALHYREQYQAALKDISTAINLEPDHVSYYLCRSVICSMLEDMSGAEFNIKLAEELEKVSGKL